MLFGRTFWLVFVFLLACNGAWAQFESIRHTVHSTAYTLEEGEFVVALVGPLQFGILDELTISTHPILHLLLTPNVSARYKLFDGAVALSMNLSYIETFLDPYALNFPGTMALFPMMTIPIKDRFAITLQTGYLMDISPIVHGMTFGGSVVALITNADMLAVGVQEDYYRGRGMSVPVVTAVYTHAFDDLHLSVGVAVGKFPVQLGSSSTKIRNLPAYPIIDIWWRL